MTFDGVEYLSVVEFAQRKKVTPQAVKNRMTAGTLPSKRLENYDYIPVEEGDRAWNVGTLMGPTAARDASRPRLKSEKKKPASMYDTALKSRTDKLTTEAKLKDLEYREKAKELVRVEEVKKAIREAANSIKRGLENFADRTHIQLASMNSPDEVYQFLNDEIHLLMENFSNADKWHGASYENASGDNAPEAKVDRKRVGRQKPNSNQASLG